MAESRSGSELYPWRLLALLGVGVPTEAQTREGPGHCATIEIGNFPWPQSQPGDVSRLRYLAELAPKEAQRPPAELDHPTPAESSEQARLYREVITADGRLIAEQSLAVDNLGAELANTRQLLADIEQSYNREIESLHPSEDGSKEPE